MKITQIKPPKAIIIAFFGIFMLQSCVFADLAPAYGFPEYQSSGEGFPPLLPIEDFDFHQNPSIQ